MRRVILTIVTTAVGLVLLLSFKTHASSGLASSTLVSPASQNSSPAAKASTATKAGTSGGSGSGSGSGSSTASTTSKTVAGDVVQTIYGPIQVSITVKGGKITAVNVPTYPNGSGRDMEINSYALPQLVQETLSANSAKIDGVSGASYTSQGYISSLQSAIDKAGL
jgi:uncharacterized protein with FMN-binding domain